MKSLTREEEIDIRDGFEKSLSQITSVPEIIKFCKSVGARPDARNTWPKVVNICLVELARKIDREHWHLPKSRYVIEKLRNDLDVPEGMGY